MVFIVTRSGSTAGSNSVNWATANGTATSAQDYFAASGTLTFAPGETAKIISVTLRNNTLIEPDEYFYVNLTSPTNGAAISDNQGAGTIIDDDGGGCGGQAC